MKKGIKLAVSAALLLGASSAFATNGTNLIGLGAESRALGGTGIAASNGSCAALTNPALLAKTKNDFEFAFSGTYFSADIDVSTTAGTNDPSLSQLTNGVSKTSAESGNGIPAISLAKRINDSWVFGLGMYGTAGMGTDWRGSALTSSNTPSGIAAGRVDLYNMRSALMLMQFVPSISYGNDTFGVGLSAIAQYGSLSIDFDARDQSNNLIHVGNGSSNDMGFGYQIGAYYNPMQALTLGFTYKSAIDMIYADQISNAAAAFGYGQNVAGGGLPGKADNLEQPSEMGVGVAYTAGNMTYTADVKKIEWGSAKGYSDFGWEDQTVYALGVKYGTKDYWFGAGYNYGENPIPNNKSDKAVGTAGNYTPGTNNSDGHTLNMFNYVMFPATVEKHYTFGGGYTISESMSIDAAFTYAPKVSDTVSASSVAAGDVTTEHSQQAITVAFKFHF
jgi:long-chain fatty acid transport protein